MSQSAVASLPLRYRVEDKDMILSELENPYILRVRDLPDNEKPREKLSILGISALSVAELVAIVLGVGTKKEEVLAMSSRILQEYGQKTISNETDPQRLSEALDIPLAKACQIVAAFELGRRYFAKKGGRPVFVRTARQAYSYLKDMGNNQKEQLRGLYLNSRYQVIHDEVISVGSLTANIVHPREVFKPALEQPVVAVILAHNHPSGSLRPSKADLEVTRQLCDAGKMLGVELLDHLIIANNRYSSLIERTQD